MQFLASLFQPTAGAAGLISRVQLPVAGRVSRSFVDVGGSPPWPVAPAPNGVRPRGGLDQHRSQHRAQCRAACMSKANF